MKNAHIVCFDLFNTLVSVGQVSEQIGRFTADVLGVDHEQWNEACFGPHHEICRPTEHFEILRSLAHSIDSSIPESVIRQATNERQRRFDHALLNAELHIIGELKRLKASGFRLALISNASTGEVSAWQQSPLAELIDEAVFSCDCGLKKPDEAIYHYTMSKLHATAMDCIYVGDGGSQEFIGAHQAGMHTVLTRQFLRSHRYQRVMREQGERIKLEVANLQELVNQLVGRAEKKGSAC